ncbi:MAG: T9SS type A sorting domain-containing protein [Bacteroidota bacterium]|nr:T9SS type A sorting domain-containing protein [Bacteroidota bacterium]
MAKTFPKGIFELCAAVLVVFSLSYGGERLAHSLRAEGDLLSPAISAAERTFPDTLNVLAVMVQFVEDSSELTSGNGQFDRSALPQRILDAPPRDSAYFADHFLFAQNYFRKVSNGKQNITATVLGRVLTLPHQMRYYSPEGTTNLPLANLAVDSWRMADSLYPSFPFQHYDLFVVFHAGSGHDVDLRGSLGYDPTPYDLPSLYFDLNGFRQALGSSFGGISLPNHPSFTITNSAILPETENRLIPGIGGDVLLQLSINGLLVANIASHLGLPDLFDTKTGGTAIGRFGLMDGQSIFSFSGLFPPEPSAWEKIYLGWTTPITIPSGSSTLHIPAVSLTTAGNDTIYKIPISAKEYFLIENRNRDVKNNGQTLTIRWNGQQFTKQYAQDDPDFNASNVDSIYGTVVDVDDFDWSLPGAVGYAGGILIWHIDETVIEKNLASNTINADPAHRGVYLEEADGSQDIGQSYGLTDPGSGSEDGTPLDFWYSGNGSPVFQNEFSETTHPNSLSNSFAHSFVTLKNFSPTAPMMTLQATLGSATVSLKNLVKLGSIKANQNDAPVYADVDADGSNELVYTSGDSIFVLKNGVGSLVSPFGGTFQPAIANIADTNRIIAVHDSMLYVFRLKAAGNSFVSEIMDAIHIPTSLSSPVFSRGLSNPLLFIGGADGSLFTFSHATQALSSTHIVSSQVIGAVLFSDSLWFAYTYDATYSSLGQVWNFQNIGIILAATLGQFENGSNNFSTCRLVVLTNNSVTLRSPSGYDFQTFPISANVTGSLALADVNGDGQLDILVGTDQGLFAFNKNGVQIENFPLKTDDGGSVVGSPVVARTTSGSVGIFFGSSNGHVYGFDNDGKLLAGFPLQTSGIVSSLAVSGNELAAVSTDSSLYVWNINGVLDSTKIFWNGFLADAYHSNAVLQTGPVAFKSQELLPASFAYNWPNPVYDKTTNIRYYLSKPATVSIKIFNMAGELVDQLSGPGVANLDNEVQWNVSKVQSGVYFARIKATSGSEEKSVIIKIAVVK